MIQYFTNALRGLYRQKGFAVLNFTGLYVSLTVGLLIGMLLFHERSFDSFHRDAGNIYRLVCKLNSPVGEDNLPLVQAPMSNVLRTEIRGLQDFTIVNCEDNLVIQLDGGRIFKEKNVVYADSSFFDIFNFDTNLGNASALLRQPNKVLLTERTATRYFPGGNAVGKSFKLGECEDQKELEVVGIMPNPPANGHLQFNMLVSWPTLQEEVEDTPNWGMFQGGRYTYLRVPPEMQAVSISEQITVTANERKDKEDPSSYTYSLQPLAQIHSDLLYAGFNASYTIDFKQFYWLGAIGLFLLLVACINYINLSTAIATRKAKEVGVRKTLGADRRQLALSFLSQTLVLSAGASVLAAITADLLLPNLNNFLDRNVVANWFSPQSLGLLVGLCLLTTLLAGLYPAFVLAGFNPAEALRGHFNFKRTQTSLNLRRGLVTFQFAVAQIFIVAIIVAASQMQLLREKPLGFRQNGVIDLRLPESDPAKASALKTEIAGLAGVQIISQCSGAPVAKWSSTTTVFNLREKYEQSPLEVVMKIADANYLKTYGIELVAGRFIEANDEQQCLESIPDSLRRYVCVINESAVKSLGFASPEAALGQVLTFGINSISPPIVGVVRDFHTSSLRESVGPTAIIPYHNYKRSLGISLLPAAANMATLASIEKIWKQIYPETLFQSVFLDEHLASLYRTESNTFSLFQLITLLALLLNGLGLVGLTAFMVEQKTKEIGVRKVLGASVISVVGLLSKDFLRLAFIGLILAAPVAYWAMNQWLADFAYRVEIQWWMFVAAGIAAIVVAFLTVSFQSVRAALANPVKSLRSE
ncbi:MAG: ABC transporter permease [Saprospiraceae bacterium]